MEKKLISYSEDGQISKLVELLKDVPDSELIDLIDNKTLRGKGEVLPLLRGIVQGLPSTDSHNIKRCVSVYKHCINILEKNEISNKSASNIVGLLMMEADSLPGTALVELSSVYIDMVKNGVIQCGKSLELLPKVLSALSSEEAVLQGERNGREYKSHVLNSLCSCRWSPQSIIHLAAMFKDVDMTADELKFVIDKIIRMFKELDIKDLPSLVYQLLLLSSKGHKRKVIEGITRFFIEQDKLHRDKAPDQSELSEDLLESGDSNEETLRQMEGTVILHINFAIKQDQGLGREFVKFLKSIQQRSTAEVLAPFNLALTLCMVCIHRFEDQVLDFLKTTIVKSFKDKEKQSQSGWAREIVPEDCDILALVLETVRNSVHGWDHVVQGLVQLGFVLMDSFGPRAVFGKVEEYSAQLSKNPTQRACHIGSEMLLHTFKAHEMVRVEILDQIFNRVITKATSPVSHYLDLLAKTVMSAPQIILECSPKVRETFDYLSFLSPASADNFLTAIQPLLKLSMSLKDALIIVLRKAMFSRQLDSRKIGVNGFLMILKHFRVLGGIQPSQPSQSFSSSQVQVDVHARYNPNSNEALCLEIMGNLRRVLTQQADVRLLFYQGIYDVLCRNTQLQGSVLDVLLTQLKKYYEPCEDVNPPIKLELCIGSQGDQIYLQEPVAHLIGCIQRCLIKVSDIRRQQRDSDNEEEETDLLQSKSELEDMMESIIRRMIKSELEDFELDKSADFSLGNSVGVKNSIYAILVMGTYEVLIEYTFNSGQFSESSIEELLQLHENYHKLSSILKEKSGAGAGKKGKAANSKIPQSMMSLECAVFILDTVVNDTAASHREAVEKLQESTEFQKYVANVAIQKIKDIQDKPKGTADSSKTIRTLCQLGGIFLKYYTENQVNGEEERKTIRAPCLEGLVTIINILIQQHRGQLSSCLCDIVECQQQDDEQEVIYHCTKKFQRLVMNLLSSEDHHNWKETAHLLNIINSLCQQLSPRGQQYEKIQNWVNKLCTEQSIDDIATCKLLFIMLLGMTQQVNRCPEMLRDMAQDIHSQLGDIDQEVEVEDRTHFSLVTHRTAAPTLLLLVLSQIERELDDTEWVVNRIKAEIAPDPDSEESILTQMEGQEKSICTRLGIIVTAFHELVQCAIPVGVCVDATIKQITRMYGTLTLLVKYFLSLYTQKAGHLTSRFEKLMKLIGNRLTQYCYAMITYIQTTESEHVQQGVEKTKKDKKKATAAAQAGKAKVMKQSKTIPNLIFAIETFEKFLIQLSKKSKVNLMEHMKISTSRDFRINTAVLTAAIDNASDEEEETDDSDDNEGEEMEMDNHSDAGDQDNSDPEESNEENEAPEDNNKRQREEEPVTASKKFKLTAKKKSSLKS